MNQAELRCRRARVQARMKDAGLDGLIIAGRGLIAQNGFLIYLTGYCPVIRPGYAFLARTGDSASVVTTESDIWIARHNGIETEMRLAAPTADGVGIELRRLVEAVGTGALRIGVVGLEEIIAADEFRRWGLLMPGVTFVPATDIVAAVKAIKTQGDLAGMLNAAAMVDDGFAAFLDALGTGATLRQATGAAEACLRSAGAQEVLVYATIHPHFLHRPTAEVPGPGALLTVFVEASSPDGYWIELARLIAVGELDADRRTVATLSLAVMDRAQASLRPGVTAAAVYAEIEQPLAAAGLVSGLWFGHGIGVDHDWPVIGRDVPTMIEPGMVVALHPHVVDPARNVGACLCDSFVIGLAGAQPLSRFPRDLIQLQPASLGVAA